MEGRLGAWRVLGAGVGLILRREVLTHLSRIRAFCLLMGDRLVPRGVLVTGVGLILSREVLTHLSRVKALCLLMGDRLVPRDVLVTGYRLVAGGRPIFCRWLPCRRRL